jgi:hypothetical protein
VADHFFYFLESSRWERKAGQVAGLICAARKPELEMRSHQTHKQKRHTVFTGVLDKVSNMALWWTSRGELRLHVVVHTPLRWRVIRSPVKQ